MIDVSSVPYWNVPTLVVSIVLASFVVTGIVLEITVFRKKYTSGWLGALISGVSAFALIFSALLIPGTIQSEAINDFKVQALQDTGLSNVSLTNRNEFSGSDSEGKFVRGILSYQGSNQYEILYVDATQP